MKNSVRQQAVLAGALMCLSALAACSDDSPSHPGLTAPSLGMVQPTTTRLCHAPDQAGQLIEVSEAARAAHLEHGDYVARYVVDPSSRSVGDGVHFTRITDAVLAARDTRIARRETDTAACRITIDVAAGSFTGSFDAGAQPTLERYPLIVDVPRVTIRGALAMQVDGRGRPTGLERPGTAVTTLRPDRPLRFLPDTEAMIVVVGNPGGSSGHGVVVEGLAFQSGRTDGTSGGMAIIALRAHDLVVRGNRFEAGLSSALDLRSSSARVEGNHGRRLGVNCGFCLAGPGDYRAEGNRLVDGGLGGIYVSAAIAHLPFSLGASPVTTVEPDALPSAAGVTAVIRNNDLRGHTRLPIGFAVRSLALGPGSSTVPQSSHVLLADNDMVGNTFGLIVDAGFPQAGTPLRGDVDVALGGNTIHGNCQSDLLVAFTRHTGALGLTNNPFLRNSTFSLDLGGDLTWNDAWFSHPPDLGNALVVNGVTVPSGALHSYDPAGCPSPPT